MANRDTWRPLSGDNLYGDRDNVRRYRDAARDEHRRFARDYELSQQGGEAFRHALTDYDQFDEDLTGGNYYPNRRHATEGGYAYGNYGGVTPEGRRYEGANSYLQNEMRRPQRRPSGPRNFQRADQRIYEDVCERLTDDDRIDASEVHVSVTNGEVTLTGQVRSRQAKRRATAIVDDVFGVKDVYNTIRVVDDQVSPIGNWRES